MAYVIDRGAGTVTPIRTATNAAGRPIPVGADPVAIAVTPDSRTVLVVSHRQNTVTLISVKTAVVVAKVKVPYLPVAIAVTPDSRTAYVTGQSESAEGIVTPVRIAAAVAGPPISVGAQYGNEPDNIVVTPDGRTAYVLLDQQQGARITPVKIASGTAGKPITVGGLPVNMTLTPNAKTLLVANWAPQAVTPIQLATRRLGRPIRAGHGPLAMAVEPGGTIVLVADLGLPTTGKVPHGHTVTPVNLVTGTAGQPVQVGAGPIAIALIPAEP
jgi:DNA-binding beta-propeller fold protein YncE